MAVNLSQTTSGFERSEGQDLLAQTTPAILYSKDPQYSTVMQIDVPEIDKLLARDPHLKPFEFEIRRRYV